MKNKEELKKEIESDLLEWILLVKGKMCSADMYFYNSILPYAFALKPLSPEVVAKARELIKQNRAFCGEGVKQRYREDFYEIGLMDYDDSWWDETFMDDEDDNEEQ